MLETWAVIAIAAAFFQNLRSALQKHLKGKLSNSAAAYSRFLYALPFAILYLLSLQFYTGEPYPKFNKSFLIYCLLGGMAQILFTVTLLWTFSFKSFAVGTTFSKLEVIIVAVLGVILLQDHLNAGAIIAIAISAMGVLAFSAGQSGIRLPALAAGFFSPATAIGLLCAFFLGASVVCFRGASLSLQSESVLMRAAFSLTVALIIQTLVMGLWIACREAEQWKKLRQNWMWATLVGAAGILASIGWFTAFTMQNASYVRSVGQIELLFTYLFSTRVFREKVTAAEMIGMLMVTAGIVLLLITT